MTTSHLVGHLRALGRTERIVAELRTKRLLTNLGPQAGGHFDDERFEPGEYVSVHEADGINVYRIVFVLPL